MAYTQKHSVKNSTSHIKMKVETIKEKWYEIRRLYCKEGFIDLYQGDSHHHPDLNAKPTMQVNNMVALYRLDGKGEWVSRNRMRGIFDALHEYSDMFTSKEIWDYCTR